MTVSAGELVARASTLVLDSINARFTEAEWLAWLNDAQREIVNLRPEANTVVAVGRLDPGVRQVLPDDAVRLVDVPRNLRAVAVPSLAIAAVDADRVEGDGGATGFVFAVTLSAVAAGDVFVDWGVAGSGGHPADAADFVDGVFPAGTLTIPAGQASGVITVPVQGDTAVESDEGFAVTLSNPVGATIAVATAFGTIINDDANEPNLLIATPGTLAFTADFGATYTHIGYPAGVNPPFVSMASDLAGGILAAYNLPEAAGMGLAYSTDYGQTWAVVGAGPGIATPDSACVRFGAGPLWVVFATDATGAVYSASDPLGAWTAHAALTESLPIVDMVYSPFGYWVALMSGPLVALQSTTDFEGWTVVANSHGGSATVHLDDVEVGAAGRSIAANDDATLAIVQPVANPWLGLVMDAFDRPDPPVGFGMGPALTDQDQPPFYYDTESPGVVGSLICPNLRRTGLDCMGGVRDIVYEDASAFHTFVDGNAISFGHGLQNGSGLLIFSSTFSTQEFTVYWNGSNSYHGPFTGLDAVDLTVNGATGIYLDVRSIDVGDMITVTLWSDSGFNTASSGYTYTAGAAQPFFEFASFAGIDPTNISAIALNVVCGAEDRLNSSFSLASISATRGLPDKLLIDNFQEPPLEQVIVFDGDTPTTADESVYDVVDTALGGYRGLRMYFGGDPVTLGDRTCTLVAGGLGTLAFIPVEETFGLEVVTIESLWNGPDGFDGVFAGLGAIDLTATEGNGIYVENTEAQPATLTIWSGGGAVSHSVSGTQAPIRRQDSGNGFQFFNFSLFTGAGVDLTEVSAIRLSWTVLIGLPQNVPRISVRYLSDKAGVLSTTDGMNWEVYSATTIDSTFPDPSVPMDVLRAQRSGLAGGFIGVPRSGTPLPAVSYGVGGVPDFGYSWNMWDADSPATDYYEGIQPVADSFVMIGGGRLYRQTGSAAWSILPDAGVDAGDHPRSLVAIR
ncbi:hypothetical protein SAMN02949497_1932 [Methylomagnum ishizawai]|uniref:Calx-beta domain-containing protein n=1 Tax=Methylomagnum ishizawai TaxID=1760988 RepID=A0A1Y6CW67_9GAMM|nr:DUF6682 family protein [Methylomagnum ishizawai]SMF94611.1 hypothetical protein SAMN02949497_1932 [Methylomagnum ishizawai]